MRRATPILAALSLLVLAVVAASAEAQIPRSAPRADLVVVYKSKRILQLRREGEVLKSFPIALGRSPAGPKRKEGDGRTPEGVYTLDWRKPDSQFYRAIHVSYPHPRDHAHAERWDVSPGGLIMLHGLPNGVPAARVGHPWNDWTDGCIAVTNEEMDEIWARVEDGTTIIIYP